MNVHKPDIQPADVVQLEDVLRGSSVEFDRLKSLISDKFGDFGRSYLMPPGNFRIHLNAYEDVRPIHESDVPLPLGLVLDIMPLLRSETWLETLGIGRGRIDSTDKSGFHFKMWSTSCFRMRERLQQVRLVSDGWLLTCDHQLFDTSRDRGKAAFTARLHWLHPV